MLGKPGIALNPIKQITYYIVLITQALLESSLFSDSLLALDFDSFNLARFPPPTWLLLPPSPFV